MKWLPYPKYKDSGVEWLGEVPADWSVGAVRRFARLESGHTPSRQKPEYWKDCTVPWFTLADVWQLRDERTETVTHTEELVSELGLENSSARLLPAGTVMLSRTASVGYSGIMGVPMATTQDFANWVCGASISPEFLLYCFREMKSDFARLMYGSTHNTIYMPDIKRLYVCVPPLCEQARIVEWIRREIDNIDTLVAKQERLIELLQEKRQALISHAVTKGLNPDAPMKPSGVEWLGDVPAHWKLMKLKNFSTLQRGHDLTDAERTEGAYPVVTSGGISGTHGSFMARGPGVVTGRYGTTGRLFYVESDYWPHNTSLYVVDFHGHDPRFVWYSLQTVDFAAHSAKAAVPGIDRNDIHVLSVTVPPKDEQLAIVSYLDLVTSKIDTLTGRAERAIALMGEHRTALISAAVTGKIDVRESPHD